MSIMELKTILLVENEATGAELGKTVLTRHGYQVIHVKSGEEAVSTVQTAPGIDLILMDIEPGEGIDGSEAAQIILSKNDIPIIFLLSKSDPEITAKAEGIRSYGFIMKNSGEAAVIASIKSGYNLFQTIKYERKNFEEALREKEERYKTIVSLSNSGAWEYNPVSGHVSCSSEYYKILGLDPAEYKTHNDHDFHRVWVDHIHPDDRENALKTISDFHNNGSKGIYENYLRMHHKNGSWIWIWSRGRALKDKNDNLTDLIFGLHIDITKLKLSEEMIVQNNKELNALNIELSTINNMIKAVNKELITINNRLEESEEHYRTLFENTGSGIIVIEEDSTISLANQFFADICGYSREDIENKKKLAEMIFKEDYNSILKEQLLMRENPDKAKFSHEIRFKNKNNELLYLLIFVSLIPGTKQCIVSTMDITDHKNAEASLKTAEEKYRNLFMNSQVGIFITEIDSGLLLEANDRFAQQYGFKDREDILRQPNYMKNFYVRQAVRDKMISFMKRWGEIKKYEVQFKQSVSLQSNGNFCRLN